MNKGLESDNTKGVRDLKQILRPLKKVQINIGLEKVDNHKGISVKVLLDSRATGIFADRKFVEKNSFKLEKLERPVKIRNIDRTGNSGGLVTHEIEVNVYYQGHCYESPREKRVSHAFKYLISNIKSYNGIKV